MKGQVAAGLLLSRPPCDAAEERELRAIAWDLLGEALAVGNAVSEFRGHRIRVDCWFTSDGLAVRCALDGQVMCHVGSRALSIKGLPASSWRAEASSPQPYAQHELQFVLNGVRRST